MHVCMNVCIYVCILIFTFIAIHLHSTFSLTYLYFIYYYLCTRLCMRLVLWVLSTWHLRFHAHSHVVVLVHCICAFTLFLCIKYSLCTWLHHVSHSHHSIYILHVCYSFCLTFIYWVHLNPTSFTDTHTYLACMLLTTVTVPCTSSMVSCNGGHTQ